MVGVLFSGGSFIQERMILNKLNLNVYDKNPFFIMESGELSLEHFLT